MSTNNYYRCNATTQYKLLQQYHATTAAPTAFVVQPLLLVKQPIQSVEKDCTYWDITKVRICI